MAYLSEAAVEQVVLDHLASLGYAIPSDAEIGPDGEVPGIIARGPIPPAHRSARIAVMIPVPSRTMNPP